MPPPGGICHGGIKYAGTRWHKGICHRWHMPPPGGQAAYGYATRWHMPDAGPPYPVMAGARALRWGGCAGALPPRARGAGRARSPPAPGRRLRGAPVVAARSV